MNENQVLEWQEPWYAIASDEQRALLTAELLRELCHGHVLWGKHLDIIARRIDRDDFLVRISDETPHYAQVHLTWARETNPRWPRTREFQSLEDWRQQCGDD
jgi:hypothetical protein